jgi:hypothetical protein
VIWTSTNKVCDKHFFDVARNVTNISQCRNDMMNIFLPHSLLQCTKPTCVIDLESECDRVLEEDECHISVYPIILLKSSTLSLFVIVGYILSTKLVPTYPVSRAGATHSQNVDEVRF